MSTHNILKENQPKLSQIIMSAAIMEFISYGLETEFETAVVNERLVFVPLKLYCRRHFVSSG